MTMMKFRNLIFPLILIAIVIFGASSCSDEKSPIEVKLAQDSWYGLHIAVISTVDTVTIRDVQINRGNMKPFPAPSLPKTLKFGEDVKFPSLNSNPKEVEVQTNLGTWTFTFR